MQSLIGYFLNTQVKLASTGSWHSKTPSRRLRNFQNAAR